MDDIERIRREMARIRHNLHEDVSEVVTGAERIFDWRRQIRKAPWVAIGAAVVAGYLIVPRRSRVRREIEDLTDLIESRPQVRPLVDRPRAEPSKEHRGFGLGRVVSWGFGLLAPMALSAAQSYASHLIEQQIIKQFQGVAIGPKGPPGEDERGMGRPRGTSWPASGPRE